MNGQREMTKYLSHDSQSLVQDLRSGPLEYEACVLSLQSQLSGNTNVMQLCNIMHITHTVYKVYSTYKPEPLFT
jgi:hypothetical protein